MSKFNESYITQHRGSYVVLSHSRPLIDVRLAFLAISCLTQPIQVCAVCRGRPYCLAGYGRGDIPNHYMGSPSCSWGLHFATPCLSGVHQHFERAGAGRPGASYCSLIKSILHLIEFSNSPDVLLQLDKLQQAPARRIATNNVIRVWSNRTVEVKLSCLLGNGSCQD